MRSFGFVRFASSADSVPVRSASTFSGVQHGGGGLCSEGTNRIPHSTSVGRTTRLLEALETLLDFSSACLETDLVLVGVPGFGVRCAIQLQVVFFSAAGRFPRSVGSGKGGWGGDAAVV